MSDRERLTAEIVVDSAAALRQLDDVDRRLEEISGTTTATVVADVETEGIDSAVRQFDSLETAAADVADELDQASADAAAFGRTADREGSRAATAFRRVGTAIAAIGAAVAIAGIAAIGSQLGASVQAASELEQSIGGVQAIFGEAADDMLRFGEQAAQAVGLSANAANQLGATLGAQLTSFGFSIEETAARTQDLIQLGADLAATFGGPVSDAVGAISALLRGETNPIERYGVALNQTAIANEALAQGLIKSSSELDLQTRAVVGLELLYRQTAAAQGQFAREADTTAGALERIRADFENARAEVGEALIPAFQSLLDLLPQIIEAFRDMAPAIQAISEQVSNIDLSRLVGWATDLPRGFAAIADVAGGAAGAVVNFNQAFADVIRGDWSALSQNLREVGDSIGGVVDNLQVRVGEQSLISALRDGVDPALALANALAFLDRQGELTEATLLRFSRIAGADVDSVAFAGFLQGMAESSQFTAQSVDVLRASWEALIRELSAAETMGRGGRAGGLGPGFDRDAEGVRNLAGSLEEFSLAAANAQLDQLFPDMPTVVGDLDSLRTALGIAGISLQEFLDADLDTGNLIGVFTEAETRILGTIAAIEESIPGLREAVITGFDLSTMGDDIEQIEGDIGGFQEFIEERATELAQLDFDLSKISVVAPNLEQLLRDAGLSASEIASAFASNLDEAEVTEALILGTEGMATTVASSFAEWVKTLTPEEFAAVNALGPENLLSNAIRGQLADSGEEIAELLNQAVTQGFDPELILDLNNIQLRGVVNTGQIPLPGGRTDAPGTGGGGRIPPNVNYEVNINNPIEPDLGTGVAIATQQIAAVSSLLVN